MIFQGPESEIARLFRETNRQLERIHSQEHDWKIERLLLDAMVLLERIGLYFPAPPPQPLSTSISFKESSMLPTTGGNTLVYTGTLSPAGSVLAPDAVAKVVSNDPAILPTVDPTSLIVTVPLPTGWVESTTTPLAIAYSTTSATTGQALSQTITPSAPVVLATGINFAQTT
jgi:hypothetical protein